MNDISRSDRAHNAEMAAPPTIIAEWEINRRESLRVELHEFKGTMIIGIRKWFTTTVGGLAPGKDGINLSLKHLPRLAAAVTQALEIARAQGNIPDGASE